MAVLNRSRLTNSLFTGGGSPFSVSNLKRSVLLKAISGIGLISLLAFISVQNESGKSTSSGKTHHNNVNLQVSNTSKNNLGESSSLSQVTANTSTTSNNTSRNNSNLKVTVNGQNIPVPANGSVQQTINSSDGSTTVSISDNRSSTGTSTNSSSSSTSVNVDSSSSTNLEVQNSTHIH